MKIYLTHFENKDAEQLYELASDKDIAFSCGWNPHKNVEESKEIINNVLNSKECYAIKEIETNKLVGSIEIKFKDKSDYLKDDNECEIGFWIGKPFQRKGYCFEAITLILKRAFMDLNISKVYCGYYSNNIPSKKIQEKVGFIRKETYPHYFVKLINEYRDVIVSIMSKEDYINRYVKHN